MNYTTLEEMIARRSPESQKRIEEAGNRLLEEYETLQAIRKAQGLTQKAIAERLGIEQVSVSRLENRADMLITTLASYIEAMGGKLTFVAEFPNKKPIALRFKEES
jgi:DNA-directed RNA polymerase specialized sigma subunit